MIPRSTFASLLDPAGLLDVPLTILANSDESLALLLAPKYSAWQVHPVESSTHLLAAVRQTAPDVVLTHWHGETRDNHQLPVATANFVRGERSRANADSTLLVGTYTLLDSRLFDDTGAYTEHFAALIDTFDILIGNVLVGAPAHLYLYAALFLAGLRHLGGYDAVPIPIACGMAGWYMHSAFPLIEEETFIPMMTGRRR